MGNMIAILLSAMLLAQGEPNTAQIDMAQADIAFRTGNFPLAKKHILSALNSGELSDVGTTILYWNLHYCTVALNQPDEAAEALFGFIAHAQNVDNKKFAEEYELDSKLAQAELMLNAYWARKSDISCRSKEFACYMTDKTFNGMDGIRIFGSMLPFCGDAKRITKVDTKKDGKFIITNVTCATRGTETYYFYNER
jgi:hypothetical protein